MPYFKEIPFIRLKPDPDDKVIYDIRFKKPFWRYNGNKNGKHGFTGYIHQVRFPVFSLPEVFLYSKDYKENMFVLEDEFDRLYLCGGDLHAFVFDGNCPLCGHDVNKEGSYPTEGEVLCSWCASHVSKGLVNVALGKKDTFNSYGQNWTKDNWKEYPGLKGRIIKIPSDKEDDHQGMIQGYDGRWRWF